MQRYSHPSPAASVSEGPLRRLRDQGRYRVRLLGTAKRTEEAFARWARI